MHHTCFPYGFELDSSKTHSEEINHFAFAGGLASVCVRQAKWNSGRFFSDSACCLQESRGIYPFVEYFLGRLQQASVQLERARSVLAIFWNLHFCIDDELSFQGGGKIDFSVASSPAVTLYAYALHGLFL